MPSAPDLAGSALGGRYELLAVIGEGTFGRVYRGYDRRLQRPVAVKVIKPWWAEEDAWAVRFEREAQLLARLSDPGVVAVYDVGQAERTLFYVTELVEGESLAARLRRGPVGPGEATEIAVQLCRALAHTHACSIIHRDIKPANVLLGAAGRVKLSDFGLARLAEGSGEGPGTIGGTPTYMAPEQARGAPPTPATDLYSVGVVLYEMLAGRPPFPGRSPIDLALSHLQEAPPPLPDEVPPPLSAVVMRALEKDPGCRYPSAAAMAAALERTGPPWTSPGRVGSTWVAAPFGRRHNHDPAGRRRAAALLVAVAALAVAMLGVALVLGHTHDTRVPDVHGLTRAGAAQRLAHLGLRARFVSRYAGARPGTAIWQYPTARRLTGAGTIVEVALSAGPAPVRLPALTGEPVAAASAKLSAVGLQALATDVPAPGVAPGTVTAQRPAAGSLAPAHSAIALSVAEVPRWRTVMTFAGTDAGDSGSFRIRGQRWRVVYRMSFVGTCTLLFFCGGPTAHVTEPATGQAIQFGLDDGAARTQTFGSGPGTFRIAITPGRDTSSWSFEIQDDY